MSNLRFIKTPFPDNHNGFDYSPASYMDVKREEALDSQKQIDSNMANKLKSLIASIFK